MRPRHLAVAVIGWLALSPAAAQTTNIDAFKDGADEAKVHSASGFVCPLFIGHFERDAFGERAPMQGSDFCAYSALDGVYVLGLPWLQPAESRSHGNPPTRSCAPSCRANSPRAATAS